MKRTLSAIVLAFAVALTANAQRLTDIQAEARFITDKMMVELGLANSHRNSLLNINLTYLNGIKGRRDIDAYGWEYRNRQLRRMLSDRQWRKFRDSYYFYRPISWRDDAYVHNIYVKYPKHGWNNGRYNPHRHGCKPHKHWKQEKHWKHDKHHKHHKYDKHHKHDKHYKHHKHHKHYKHGDRHCKHHCRD